MDPSKRIVEFEDWESILNFIKLTIYNALEQYKLIIQNYENDDGIQKLSITQSKFFNSQSLNKKTNKNNSIPEENYNNSLLDFHNTKEKTSTDVVDFIIQDDTDIENNSILSYSNNSIGEISEEGIIDHGIIDNKNDEDIDIIRNEENEMIKEKEESFKEVENIEINKKNNDNIINDYLNDQKDDTTDIFNISKDFFELSYLDSNNNNNNGNNGDNEKDSQNKKDILPELDVLSTSSNSHISETQKTDYINDSLLVDDIFHSDLLNKSEKLIINNDDVYISDVNNDNIEILSSKCKFCDSEKTVDDNANNNLNRDYNDEFILIKKHDFEIENNDIINVLKTNQDSIDETKIDNNDSSNILETRELNNGSKNNEKIEQNDDEVNSDSDIFEEDFNNDIDDTDDDIDDDDNDDDYEETEEEIEESESDDNGMVKECNIGKKSLNEKINFIKEKTITSQDSLNISNNKKESSSIIISKLNKNDRENNIINKEFKESTNKQKSTRNNSLLERFKKFKKNNENIDLNINSELQPINKNNVININNNDNNKHINENVNLNNKNTIASSYPVEFYPSNNQQELLSQNEMYENKSYRFNYKTIYNKLLNNKIIFDKKHLKHLEVIGQADKKFIVCKLTKYEINNQNKDNKKFSDLLVLLDQHAIDERIQLEILVDQYKHGNSQGNGPEITQLTPAIRIILPNYEIKRIKEFIKEFKDIGIYFVEDDLKQCHTTNNRELTDQEKNIISNYGSSGYIDKDNNMKS
eukprot:jgi/Orpsp1_1/1176162/evm.model.c7180000056617.1